MHITRIGICHKPRSSMFISSQNVNLVGFEINTMKMNLKVTFQKKKYSPNLTIVLEQSCSISDLTSFLRIIVFSF